MGMVIVGGVIAIARNNRDKDHHDHHAVSDIRLKTDIRYVETLPNGVRLHAYKYRGDDRYFVGVLAQELLEDPKFADAVVTVDGGYLAVNYHKLGLELVNGQQMKAAGLKAISG